MKLESFCQILTAVTQSLAIASLSTFPIIAAINQPSFANSNKFSCEKRNGTPVTMVRTSRGNETFIRWVVRDFKAFPPEKRCAIVSARFQQYYDNGSVYITSKDNFKGYPVLCIASRKGGSCANDQDVLVTLKPGTDTGRVLRQILDFRRGADAKPIELSGSQYVSYSDGDLYVDVKQLVDTDDSAGGNKPAVTNIPSSAPLERRF
ncbi:hypothetical protein DP113_14475 [Brasilonema octagenarum UFV-E1]|uniref:Uncharacterized protein n=1 Tax=Brasilonema sennae CENA114 TaxID=415709 RepID=A0A856MF69_9CYAN|nr:COP23 domain-containing protein [Brasilonema sennae]QDL08954.1 hypothetical protein DP114_14545 [Brasilonema sennae CENA114]QDL15309.1 hypothetical protein DP113_14475 [Brasilonema octagenarum UFV-E1]